MNLYDEKAVRAQLIFAYRVIIASEDLLKEAVKGLSFDSDFSEELYNFYEKHRKEEREHADWLLEDLGGQVPDEIDWTAVCLAGSQFYLIRYIHPALLLGYMQALENPAPLSLIEELETIHGKQLLRTWRHHAEVDGEHKKEIAALIALVPDALKSKIIENRDATFYLWNSILKRYDNA